MKTLDSDYLAPKQFGWFCLCLCLRQISFSLACVCARACASSCACVTSENQAFTLFITVKTIRKLNLVHSDKFEIQILKKNSGCGSRSAEDGKEINQDLQRTCIIAIVLLIKSSICLKQRHRILKLSQNQHVVKDKRAMARDSLRKAYRASHRANLSRCLCAFIQAKMIWDFLGPPKRSYS